MLRFELLLIIALLTTHLRILKFIIKTASYAACPRYFRAVSGSFTPETAEYVGKVRNTVNRWLEDFVLLDNF
jgi:hypothetical protein